MYLDHIQSTLQFPSSNSPSFPSIFLPISCHFTNFYNPLSGCCPYICGRAAWGMQKLPVAKSQWWLSLPQPFQTITRGGTPGTLPYPHARGFGWNDLGHDLAYNYSCCELTCTCPRDSISQHSFPSSGSCVLSTLSFPVFLKPHWGLNLDVPATADGLQRFPLSILNSCVSLHTLTTTHCNVNFLWPRLRETLILNIHCLMLL